MLYSNFKKKKNVAFLEKKKLYKQKLQIKCHHEPPPKKKELDCEEIWAPKNWWFWTMMLEKTPGSPLDCKEIQPVHPKGDRSWVFFGRTDVEAETPILWPPDVKSWLIWKYHDAGKDWGQEENGTTQDEMIGWHHRLNGHGFVWTPGVGDGQGGLECCSSWGRKESDTTEWLNWTGYIPYVTAMETSDSNLAHWQRRWKKILITVSCTCTSTCRGSPKCLENKPSF